MTEKESRWRPAKNSPENRPLEEYVKNHQDHTLETKSRDWYRPEAAKR